MSSIVKASFVRNIMPKENHETISPIENKNYITEPNIQQTSKSRYIEGIGTMVNLEVCAKEETKEAEKIITDAVLKAKAIEEEARQKALAIIGKAENESRAVMAEAQEKGYNDGFNRGVEEGKSKEAEKISASLEEIQYLIEILNIERVQNYREAEEELAKMSFEIAKKIMRQQIKVEKDSIPRMIEDIVKENETALRIYLSEYNHTLFTRIDRMTREKIKELLPEVKVVVLPNDDGTEEIIQIETENGMIDAAISGQLERLKHAVMDEK